MKTLLSLSLLLTATLPAADEVPAFDCGRDCGRDGAPDCCATTTADQPAVPSHPVKGVVKGLLPEKTALLVKHEEVPGVMRAMTMMFKVEPAVLEKVKPGDAITARMSRRDDGWWLHEVEVIPPAGKS